MSSFKIPIISQEEAEECVYVVCIRKGQPTPFDDNEEGTCCQCGNAVVFRPHAPKRPARLCLECMLEQVEATRQ
jgi:hypothetical protein